MFFSDENNRNTLNAFVIQAQSIVSDDNAIKQRLLLTRKIVEMIYASPEGWDQRCSFNIKYIGNQFLSLLSNFKIEQLNDIYTSAYRFLCEFDFMVGTGKELSIEARQIKNQIQHDTAGIDDVTRSQIIYASYIMPVNITKDFLNDENIECFKKFEAKKVEAETLKAQWTKEIEAKKAEVDVIANKLDEYTTAFNFVGLYDGFNELGKLKKDESSRLLYALIGMAILIISPLLLEVGISLRNLYFGQKYELNTLLGIIPLLSLEIVLIYYFRVILHNFNSVRAQQIQIELRQTLCQFIQSYAEYATKIKKNDSVALEKFENLIFSGIVADPEKLPTTFDGIEHVANLVKALKS